MFLCVAIVARCLCKDVWLANHLKDPQAPGIFVDCLECEAGRDDERNLKGLEILSLLGTPRMKVGAVQRMSLVLAKWIMIISPLYK